NDPFRETDPLGGYDPYSASKAASEIVIESYRRAFFQAQGLAIATARAGNVIGGGDLSDDRLIPDAVRAWENNAPLLIRHPDAIRPWQHVLEPLSGYLRLAELLWHDPRLATAFNFGPAPHEAATVRSIIDLARTAYGGAGQVQYDHQTTGPYEATWLALETSKARQFLSYSPRWTLTEAIEHTMHWYRAYSQGSGAHKLCARDIDSF